MSIPGVSVLTVSSESDATELVTDRVTHALQDALSSRPRASLAVPGGRTPISVLPRLAAGSLAWDRVDVTLTDERWVPTGDPLSNQGQTERLLHQGPAAESRLIPLWNHAPTPTDGLAETHRQLAAMTFPIDVLYLGMGEDGHIASLFPADDTQAFMGGKNICMAATAPNGGAARMSLALETLKAARKIVLHITGPAKKRVLDTAMHGAPDPMCPVSLLLHSGHVDVSVVTAP